MGLDFRDIYDTITNKIPNFKKRESQLQMMEIIDSLISKVTLSQKDGDNICLIEAPTGTGKSLAYLVSGIIGAKNANKKLVISTATKTLQSQLADKDIPLFLKHSGIECDVSLAKGRGNYLCPYQLALSLDGLAPDLLVDSSSVSDVLSSIKTLYSSGDWDGDLDTSSVAIDNKYRPLITTDKDRCLGYSCPYNTKDECNCPFYNNRAKLKSAQLIVTNHSLLLADLATGGGGVLSVKPSEYILCVDEAHSFSDIAVNSFTGSFELKRTIGICNNLANLVYNPHNQSYVSGDTNSCDELFEQINKLINTLDDLSLFLEQNQQLFVNERLILNDYLNPIIGTEFKDRFMNIAFEVEEVIESLQKMMEVLKSLLKSSPDSMVESNLNRLGFYFSSVTDIAIVAAYVINQDDSRYNANARWIDTKIVKNNKVSPTDFVINAGITYVGKIIFDKLWTELYVGIITSATLAIGNDFGFYKHKLGLNLYPLVESYKLPSHFNYESNSQIVVPRFKYSPDFSNRLSFDQELVTYLEKALDYSDGYGTLVLFFNRSQLINIHSSLPKSLQARILLQTDYMSNQRLINDHKKIVDSGKPSVIFGLNSFAEGVDLPALYCVHVIITKLPFETHKDPYSMVKEYWLTFEKCNYFTDVALPETCIKLIQATGRLIRDETDYGQITICDNRVVLKNYGALLLNALPPFNRKYKNSFIDEAFARISMKS